MKKSKKIVNIITCILMITSFLVVNLIIPINATSTYVTDEDDENSYNKTIVNGSLNIGTITETADSYIDGSITYDNVRLWTSSTITENVIFPIMTSNTIIDVYSETFYDDEYLSQETSVNRDVSYTEPIYKIYKDIKWGEETIENTYMTEWEQKGSIKFSPTVNTRNKLYHIFIEVQDVLCYGKNLIRNEQYTGQNHSIITAFEINLNELIDGWEELNEQEILNTVTAFNGLPGIKMQDYYEATNVATGETINGKLELVRSVNKSEGIMTFGLNLPEFDDEEIWKISGIKPFIIVSNNNKNSINCEFTTRYTCLKNIEYIETLLVQKRRVELPNIVGMGEWISTALSGFMEAELYQGVTIGGILAMLIAFSMVIWLLKLFAGG